MKKLLCVLWTIASIFGPYIAWLLMGTGPILIPVTVVCFVSLLYSFWGISEVFGSQKAKW